MHIYDIVVNMGIEGEGVKNDHQTFGLKAVSSWGWRGS